MRAVNEIYKMEDLSIFPDKNILPTERNLKTHLGDSHKLWQQIHNFVFEQYPDGIAEWNFPGKKYGWSYRIKDKKRAIIYFLPRERYFKVAFVFGDKAVAEIMESEIADSIKNELNLARKYAEGRGIQIEIRDNTMIADIENLILIKMGKLQK